MAANVESFTSWSTTLTSNQPTSGDTADIVSDLTKIQAEVRKYLATKGSNIASGATVDLSAATGNYVHITGTTTITALGTVSAGVRFLLVFDDALTLTHNATSLILPGAANITTVAGDRCEVVSLGSGNWRCSWYQRASGVPLSYDPELLAIAGLTSAANKIPMFSGSGTATVIDFLDEDNMASDSNTGVPSQQSVKAYISSAVTTAVDAAKQGGTLTLGTAQTASGSSVDFTGIPSWVKRITLEFTGLSFAAAGAAKVRLGISTGLVATGYTGARVTLAGSTTPILDSFTDGVSFISASAAGTAVQGTVIVTKLNGNIWKAETQTYRETDAVWNQHTAFVNVGGTLDRISIVATTSTFDAGTVNIMYE